MATRELPVNSTKKKHPIESYPPGLIIFEIVRRLVKGNPDTQVQEVVKVGMEVLEGTLETSRSRHSMPQIFESMFESLLVTKELAVTEGADRLEDVVSHLTDRIFHYLISMKINFRFFVHKFRNSVNQGRRAPMEIKGMMGMTDHEVKTAASSLAGSSTANKSMSERADYFVFAVS